MLLAEVAATSGAVAVTRARLVKRALLVATLRRAAGGGPDEVGLVARYLGGELRQRRTGLGSRALADLPPPADEPSLSVTSVDATFEALAGLSGPGTAALREAAAGALFAAALTADDPTTALSAIGLTVGRPVRPVLAASAPSVAAAFATVDAASERPAVVDVKLDGIRIQVHRDGDDVRVFTRSFDDITGRVPEIVAIARAMPGQRFVLDGEALAVDAAGRPRPFRETNARAATRDAELAASTGLTPFFFDALHAEDRDLLDEPPVDRLAVLDRLAAGHTVDRIVTADVTAAQERFAAWVGACQEGVVVKSPTAGYAAGRRGAGWVKVKPRHTLDLVVLTVERGSGRRAGQLSNIHLGARDLAGGFVMLGKTFKGMTDAMLAWQTERFTELAVEDNGWVVTVRPVQVVEIAFDGVQRSSRYPGGVALRFARVLRYRDDKSADEATRSRPSAGSSSLCACSASVRLRRSGPHSRWPATQRICGPCASTPRMSDFSSFQQSGSTPWGISARLSRCSRNSSAGRSRYFRTVATQLSRSREPLARVSHRVARQTFKGVTDAMLAPQSVR